jgi:hypothetical protein
MLSDDFSVLCRVHADTSRVVSTLLPRHEKLGPYYTLEIDAVLSFGVTELKAQIAWEENVSFIHIVHIS